MELGLWIAGPVWAHWAQAPRVSRFAVDISSAVRPRESVVLDEDGVAEHLLRTPRWVRTSRGLYVPRGTSRTPAQRILSAAALMPSGAVLGGWAAGHVHGVDLLDGLDRHGEEIPVEVLLPPGLHRLDVPGVHYRRAGLDRAEVVVAGDLLVTPPLRTAVDLACWAGSVVEATVALDLLLAAGLSQTSCRASLSRGDAVPSRRGKRSSSPGPGPAAQARPGFDCCTWRRPAQRRCC